jgi:hypothetical protein
MDEVLRNICPKCSAPTRLSTYTYEQSCASCNRIDQLEAQVAALIQEKGECPHRFHYFGSKKTRRCVKCNKLESE